MLTLSAPEIASQTRASVEVIDEQGEGKVEFGRPYVLGTNEPDPQRPCAQGLLDGGWETDPGLGPAFYEALARYRDAEEAYKASQEARQRWEQEREALRQKAESWRPEQERARREFEDVSARHRELLDELERARTRRRQLEDGAAPSLTRGVLNALAASLFAAGDFVVARQIVSQVVRIPDDRPWEAWLFAAGIAAVAVPLKFVYDEVIHHQRDRRPRVFEAVSLGVALLVLLTVGLLGGLRADVIAAEKRGENLQLNWLHTVGLVLVGLAFAVAGAICLSSALEDFHRWWQGRKAKKREHDLANRRGQLESRLQELTAQLARTFDEAALRAAEEKYEAACRAEEQRRQTYLERMGDKRCAAHRLGYALGHQVAGRPAVRWRRSTKLATSVETLPGERPHVAVRQQILQGTRTR